MKEQEQMQIVTEYGMVSDGVIRHVVDEFIDNFHSDFQMDFETSKDILSYTEQEQKDCVDRFLDFMGDDLRPNLLKALSNMITAKNEELKQERVVSNGNN